MKKVNDYLVKNKVKPDLIISSHAVRAYETARLIAADLGYQETQIMQDREIYLGNEDSLLDIVFALPDHLESVMLVGHNPIITGFAQMFQARIPEDMPTSAVVSISIDTKNWNQILMATKNVNFYIYPKML
jgi:phosphohistidine phosphatase